MGKVRIAIAGVGNCASSLVQGLEYYRDADDGARVPGLMHVRFGPYHISDVEVVAAFDVDAKKVGCDLADAIHASENNTIKIAEVPPTGVTVQRGPTLDGLGEYYREIITESDEPAADVVGAELHVHQAGHPAVRGSIGVVLHALDQGTSAVAHADDGYPYRSHQDGS